MSLSISSTKIGSLSLAALTTMALSFAVNVRVLAVKLVPSITVSLASVDGRGAISPAKVLLQGDGFKVVRIAAQAVSAQVVNGKAIGDRPLHLFIREPVDVNLRTLVAHCVEGPHAIALGNMAASPRPTLPMTSRAINLGPETNLPRNLVMFHTSSIVTKGYS